MTVVTKHGYTPAQRLRKKTDYDAVFANADRSYCRLLTVLYRPNHYALSRLGIICGRKVHKRAHERNRLKRLCRESFRQSDRVKQFAQSVDMIVLPKPAASQATNADILDSLQQHWQRIGGRLAKIASTAAECQPSELADSISVPTPNPPIV